MGKLVLKPGDIFEALIDETSKQYIQYLMDDPTCLSGNVIRAFDYEAKVDKKVDLAEVAKSKVKFIAHVVLKGGVKLGVWGKIGNVPLEKDFKIPFFRDTDDVTKPEVKKSFKWFVWKVGSEHKRIGELTDEYRQYPIGGITHPIDLIERLKTGSDGFKYPD